MAVGVAIKSDGKQYAGKITWFVLLSCMVAASGGIIFGYDVGVSGGVTSMDPFLKKFFPSVYTKMKGDTDISNYCKFDSQLLTSFTSSLYIAGLLSSFFAAIVTRDYGRRPSIIIGGLCYMFGAALGGSSTNILMLIVGRLLLGVGLGFTNQGSLQRRLPDLRQHRVQLRHPHKLRDRQDHRRVGMEDLHRPGRRPGRSARLRRALPPGDPQQPHPNQRRSQQGEKDTPENPRHERRRRRARRPDRGEPGLESHQAPVQEPDAEEVQASARHVGDDTLLPADHRDQHHRILRSAAVPDDRVGRERVSAVGYRDRDRVVQLYCYNGYIGGQDREEAPVSLRGNADAGVAGSGGGDHGSQARGPRDDGEGVRAGGAGAGVRFHVGVRAVVGAAGVGGDERDIPAGDTVGGAEHRGGDEPLDDVRDSAGVPGDALPPQVGDILLLRGVGAGDVGVRLLFSAGDEEYSDREDESDLGGPLFLEAVCR